MKISAEYIWVNSKGELQTRNKTLVIGPAADKPNKHNKSSKTFSELSCGLDQSELFRLYLDQDWWRDDNTSRSYIDYFRRLIIPNLILKEGPRNTLNPVCATVSPLRDRTILVLCDLADTSYQEVSNQAYEISQYYSILEGNSPLTTYGYAICTEHEDALRECGIAISECGSDLSNHCKGYFKLTAEPTINSNHHLLLSRYILYRIAEASGFSILMGKVISSVGGPFSKDTTCGS